MNEAHIKLTDELVAAVTAATTSPEARELVEATEKATDHDAGTFEVVITTENLDRYGEVIKLDGWELEHYRSNPIVLWGHDHKQLPIGIATNLEVKDGKMVAQGKFALHAFAQTVRQLYDAGVMRATSVGFIEKEREGNLITKAELIEFSFVSVPANPYALSTMVKSGIHINEMVTKGFVNIKEAEEEEAESPEEEVSEPTADEQPTDEPETDEKQFDREKVKAAITALRDATIALEALDHEEPEGDEASEEDDEEAEALKRFNEGRKLLQDASTMLGEVLAEARKAIEAKRSL